MADPTIATPADFAEPETKVIELPRPTTGGKVLAVKIRAVPIPDLLRALDGVPELARGAGHKEEKTFAQMRELLLQQQGPNEAVALLGVVEPVFAFSKDEPPLDGMAPWRNVHSENQQFIISEIMELAGLTDGKKDEAAAAATRFRGVAGNAAVGAGDGVGEPRSDGGRAVGDSEAPAPAA